MIQMPFLEKKDREISLLLLHACFEVSKSTPGKSFTNMPNLVEMGARL
jgi:hypothetical protein